MCALNFEGEENILESRNTQKGLIYYIDYKKFLEDLQKSGELVFEDFFSELKAVLLGLYKSAPEIKEGFKDYLVNKLDNIMYEIIKD